MSKSHGNDGFRQRFKQFLGIKKATTITTSVYEGPKAEELTFTNELLQEISFETPVPNRTRVLKELCEFLNNRKLEDHAIEAAWMAVKDLLLPTQPQEARHVTLQFLSVIVTSQYDRLKILRAHFFKVIEHHKIADDLIPRLDFLKALSKNGKDILYFEEQIGAFVLSWMPEVIEHGRLDLFMPLLINVIHYHSSYLDEDVVAGILRETCLLSRSTKVEQNVELSLNLLDAIVRYSSIPISSLYEFIAAVCCTVNLEKFCQHSWKIMRNVLGTHLGHRGVYTMCLIMESGSDQSTDVMLVRGAVFFIGMCLWGSQRVTTLKHSHSTVLPSMLQALSCGHSVVSLEVALSIQRLVKKYGHELHIVSWDSIMDITEKLQALIEEHPQPENSLVENHHILLNYIEELVETTKYNGSEDRFFNIVERCANKRPESSIHLLVSYKAQSVHPAHADWIQNLQTLLEKYFRYEIRTSVRVKVLDVLSFVLTSYRHWYEEELLDRVVLPYLGHISDDQDVTVRTSAVQLLLDLSQTCDSSKCTDILNIIEKVISRPVELPGKMSPTDLQDQRLSQEEKVLKDIKTAINGLVQVFRVKLFRLPHSHAQLVFEMLVSHLRAHYYHGYSTIIASIIRNIAFECFLSLRCDSSHRLGITSADHEEKGQVKYSNYFVCTPSAIEPSDSKSGYSSPLGVIQYSEAFNVILSCVQYEWDWTVVEQVLTSLPDILQNKTLVLAANPNLATMSSVLCKMVSDPSCMLDLQRIPHGVGRTGLHALIFPVLTVLATYHSKLDRRHQCELVQSLELGLVSKCANLCVSSLTLCTMEMQAVITSLLPAILVRLSQISATVTMAVPMLEFLSGLVHLPHLYMSFKENQYKSVFAICLPYTDSQRYSQYTVTLAYHVIAAWFVRARIAYRKGFVGFIAKSLRTSMVIPERHDSRCESPALGIRTRSGSAGQQSYSPQTPTRSASPVSPPQMKESEYEFHAEMSEVCMDMMARYSFAPCLSQPKRHGVPLVTWSNRKWMIGNTIVSITTSGTYIEPDGICDNCYSLRERISSQMKPTADLQARRRRSRESLLDRALASKSESPGGTGERVRIVTPPDSDSGSNTDKGGHVDKTPDGKGATSGGRSRTPEPQATAAHGGLDCHCVCQGWAEIVIRRASGNISWVMRIQNRPTGPLLGMPGTDGDVSSAVMDEEHIREYLLSPLEGSALKIRTQSHEVLSSSTDDTLLIDVIKKEGSQSRVNLVQETNNTASEKGEWPDAQSPGRDDLSPDSDSDLQSSPRDSFSPDMHFGFIDSSSTQDRPRLLSVSPRRGPNAIRMARYSESSDNHDPPRSPGDVPQPAKRQLQFEKLASDGESVKSLSIEDVEDMSREKMQHMVSSVQRRLKDDPFKPKAMRPRSLPPGFASNLDTSALLRKHHAAGKGHASESDDCHPAASHATTSHTTPSALRSPGLIKRVLGESRSATSSPLSPKRTKLKKSVSLSTPKRKDIPIRRDAGGDSREVQSSHDLIDTSDGTRARLLSRAHKSSSSPELSSPTLYRASAFSRPEPNSRSKKSHERATTVDHTSAHVTKDVPDVPITREPPQMVPATESYRYPLDPNFVFLQLYHASFLGPVQEKPVPLPDGEVIERAVKCLDRIPTYDTHKIGVIYVGPGQHDNEVAILRNVYGSDRYMKFLGGLGRLVRLRDCPPAEIYLGGLDREGGDGEFAYSWQDDICQVIFHVATLMPTRDSDPGCNSKKMHIGNNFVTIVYNDSGEQIKFGKIKGQFNFAELVIRPLDNECNVVTVRFKEELKNLIVNTGPRVISDNNLAMLVRRLGIHINMASVLHQGSKRTTDAYGCNWLERLRQIKRLRTKASPESHVPSSPPPTMTKSTPLGSGAFGQLVRPSVTSLHPHLVDFTDFVSKDTK